MATIALVMGSLTGYTSKYVTYSLAYQQYNHSLLPELFITLQ
ncbi:hypothetical protein [Virgibacillus pantothenticus]|nr:hypothetical protein [Virgibacillus pantothenticus]MEB5453479.1 hypothetical protein [Virgibacillus pantothenticus]MEB5461798.1 hypothetical protein [Virgibacillus pantothenticus]MEB5466001.1 hypothetical protein [Virgibacillus pantothenticus]